MNLMSIVDLHCDLLYYVATEKDATVFDEKSKCSFPLFIKGGVTHQTLAVFTETVRGSTDCAKKQLAAYNTLPESSLTFSLSIENGSGLLEEDEPIHLLEERIDALAEKPLYVSLTWNTENRFGGGNESSRGLTDDGRVMLEHLYERNIPVDLSHTSDFLAHDILSYKDPLIILASHSNARSIWDAPRNLPDEFIDEIIRRNGVIGMNVVNKFVGKRPEHLLTHIEYIRARGGDDHLAFGADFFYGMPQAFFPELTDASCYPFLTSKINDTGFLEKLCHKNALRFMKCVHEEIT